MKSGPGTLSTGSASKTNSYSGTTTVNAGAPKAGAKADDMPK